MRKTVIAILQTIFIPKESRRPVSLNLISTIITIVLFGLIMIYSASSYLRNDEGASATHFVRNQSIFAMIAIIVMIIVSYVDYHFILRWALPFYAMVLGLLVFVHFFGHSAKGQARWIRVGFFNFQPSELAKIAIIIILALVLTNLQERLDHWKGWLIVGIWLLPVVAIIRMSNLSTAIIVALIAFGMMFTATKKPWVYLLLLAMAILFMFLIYKFYPQLSKLPLFLRAYQMNRIKIWINPEAYSNEGGRQVLDSLYAIGSGGPLGRGLGGSIKKRYGMSEAHNDIIFAVIVEELGLVGAIFLILGYLFLIYQITGIARRASDKYGLLLVSGVMVHIAIQVILNIMVATNSMPNTGVSLPFVSYGGTSLLGLMIEMGIVLGVQRKR